MAEIVIKRPQLEKKKNGNQKYSSETCHVTLKELKRLQNEWNRKNNKSNRKNKNKK